MAAAAEQTAPVTAREQGFGAHAEEIAELGRALVLSQREADEREAAEEWTIALKAAEAATEVEAVAPPPAVAVPPQAECVVCMSPLPRTTTC